MARGETPIPLPVDESNLGGHGVQAQKPGQSESMVAFCDLDEATLPIDRDADLIRACLGPVAVVPHIAGERSILRQVGCQTPLGMFLR